MSNTHHPVCPHCNYEFDDEETWFGLYSENRVHTGDGDESDLKCPQFDCGKEFKARCVHIVMFEDATDE